MASTYVFLHGLGQFEESWKETAAALFPPGHAAPVYIPNLPSLLAGRETSYPALYAALEEQLNHLEGKLTLCGLSLGAVLALDYASRHPQKAEKLVLIGGQYKMPKALLTVQNLVFRLMPRAAFAFTGLTKPQMISLCRTMAPLNFTQALPQIACPALVLCGERDRANRKAAETMAAALPKARINIVPNAGHEVNKDCPKELAALLQEFFDE